MDIIETRPGNTVYLPVTCPGGLLYLAQFVLAGPLGAGAGRGWDKARYRPSDIPWHEQRRPEAPRQATRSREQYLRVWNHAPWQQQGHGGWLRRLWNHTVVVYQHADPRFEGAWFVLLDETFSPYFYATRAEAEQAGFELLYEKVKYLDV